VLALDVSTKSQGIFDITSPVDHTPESIDNPHLQFEKDSLFGKRLHLYDHSALWSYELVCESILLLLVHKPLLKLENEGQLAHRHNHVKVDLV